MKTKHTYSFFVCAATIASLGNSASGQLLYSENFDTNHSSNWRFNASPDTDSDADFYYDYSLIGVPPAPGVGSTRGMKIQANLFDGIAGGASASPIGQSFTGDYVLSWDMWSNYSGGIAGIGNSISGSTNLSYGGVGSSGTFSNTRGSADGVFFAYTGDGYSSADYRAYSQDRPISYQLPPVTDPFAPNYCGCDGDATYLAGSRNNSADMYRVNINPEPDPVAAPGVGSVSAPAAQVAIAAAFNPPVDQSGFVPAGAAGFAWRHNEISVVSKVYTWVVDGTILITIDGNNFTTQPGGGNIFFGHGDINDAVAPFGNFADELLFTLVDNIEVHALTAILPGDGNGDGWVDGLDYLLWAGNFGTHPGADGDISDGDFNDDGWVDGLDYLLWAGNFGTHNSTAVPEPGAWLLAVLAFAGLLAVRPARIRAFGSK